MLSNTQRQSERCCRELELKHSCPCVFCVLFNSSSTSSVHPNVLVEKCVTPALLADLITRGAASLAVPVARPHNETWLLATKKIHHFGLRRLLVFPIAVFMHSNCITFHWNCNQGAICLHEAVPFTRSRAGGRRRRRNLLIVHVHVSPDVIQNKSKHIWTHVRRGLLKDAGADIPTPPWGRTQLNGCPQRMKEKWTFDLDYVSILQNATTRHKVDFNSDDSVFHFPTVFPHVYVQSHSQSWTNPKGLIEADMIGTPRRRWVHHHILFMDRELCHFFTESFLKPTDTFLLSGTATQLTPTISESYFSLICHQSGNFVFDFL